MMQDGFPPGAAMAMGMPGDFSMQVRVMRILLSSVFLTLAQDQAQMFPGGGLDGPVSQSATPVPGSRGAVPYRARGNIGGGMRGRGFPGRGRGRGGMYPSESGTYFSSV